MSKHQWRIKIAQNYQLLYPNCIRNEIPWYRLCCSPRKVSVSRFHMVLSLLENCYSADSCWQPFSTSRCYYWLCTSPGKDIYVFSEAVLKQKKKKLEKKKLLYTDGWLSIRFEFCNKKTEALFWNCVIVLLNKR